MLWWKNKRPKERLPVAGEIWCYDDKSPWPTKNKVRILDFKDGWVRYDMVVFKDSRAEWSAFKKRYKPYDEGEAHGG